MRSLIAVKRKEYAFTSLYTHIYLDRLIVTWPESVFGEGPKSSSKLQGNFSLIKKFHYVQTQI